MGDKYNQNILYEILKEFIKILYKDIIGGCSDSSAVKSTYWFSRGSGFNFQHLLGAAHNHL